MVSDSNFFGQAPQDYVPLQSRVSGEKCSQIHDHELTVIDNELVKSNVVYFSYNALLYEK